MAPPPRRCAPRDGEPAPATVRLVDRPQSPDWLGPLRRARILLPSASRTSARLAPETNVWPLGLSPAQTRAKAPALWTPAISLLIVAPPFVYQSTSVHPTPSLQHDEIVRQVQRLAGRAFLSCMHFEEHLKHVLKVMAEMRIGKLKPSDAEGILDGSRKLTSGQAYRMILANLDGPGNMVEAIECALAARNQLIHAFPFHRCAHIKSAEHLKAVQDEIQPLCDQLHEGVEMLQRMLKILIVIMARNCPAMKNPESHRRLEKELNLRIIYEDET